MAEFGEAVPDGTSREQIHGAVEKGLNALVLGDIIELIPVPSLVTTKAGVD
ncbi:hypothetical protein [Nonomuraea sp. NPDC002799]